MKADRQLPLNFSGTLKLTQDWYTQYRALHAVLEANPTILERVHADLSSGVEKLKRNIAGVPAECILRLAVVQQVEGLSIRGLIVRVDDSSSLRFFCRFYDDPIIAHSTYATLVNLIKPKTWEDINNTLVKYAQDKNKVLGEKLRMDTTAVETNIRFPMDSNLLWDSVRVLARLINRIRKLAPSVAGQGRARSKDAKRLAVSIARGGKKMHKGKRKKLYRKLIAAAERMLKWALDTKAMIDAAREAELPMKIRLGLMDLSNEIQAFQPLIEKCVKQARNRVLLELDVPNEEKIFSLFEPHTELLIRGKAGKAIEFGHMVELHQVEGGLITGYKVHAKRPAEAPLLEKGIERHTEIFGHPPKSCSTDKGFYSAAAQKRAKALGVEEVCVPKKGRRNEAEATEEGSLWFKLGQKFRAGIEGTISVLKRVYGLRRCLREGYERFESWVGAGVVAHNLILLTRK